MKGKILFKDIANVVPSIVAIAAENYIPEINLHADNFTIINITEISAKGVPTLFDREVLSIETTPNNLLYIVLGVYKQASHIRVHEAMRLNVHILQKELHLLQEAL